MIEKIQQTNFRLSDELIDKVLRLANEKIKEQPQRQKTHSYLLLIRCTQLKENEI